MARPKGQPKLGGRVKGTPNKATVIRWLELERAKRVAGVGPPGSPLEAMLWVMNQCWALGDQPGVLAAAREAAPYVHAKLISSEVRVHTDRRSDAEIAAEIELLRRKIELSRQPPLIEAKAEPAAATDESADESEPKPAEPERAA